MEHRFKIKYLLELCAYLHSLEKYPSRLNKNLKRWKTCSFKFSYFFLESSCECSKNEDKEKQEIWKNLQASKNYYSGSQLRHSLKKRLLWIAEEQIIGKAISKSCLKMLQAPYNLGNGWYLWQRLESFFHDLTSCWELATSKEDLGIKGIPTIWVMFLWRKAYEKLWRLKASFKKRFYGWRELPL